MNSTEPTELIFAVTGVLASTQACADHGDRETFDVLARYYAVAAEEVRAAQGRVIKVMGDGLLLTFPIDDPHTVINSLRSMQVKTNEVWQRFDSRCSVQVKVGTGTVIAAMLGAPGDERLDIVGMALNKLMKAPWGPFEIMPELSPV